MSELDRALRIVKNTHFYPQGGEAKFAYSLSPLPACGLTDLYGVSYGVICTIVRDNFSSWFLGMEGCRIISAYFLKRLQEDPTLTSSIEEAWYRDRVKFHTYCDKVIDSDLSTKNLKELTDMLLQLVEVDTKVWAHVVFIDTFDEKGDEIVTKCIRKHAPALLNNKDLLMTPDEPSYVQLEEINLLKIALAVKDGEDSASLLQKHQQEFFWYKNNFAIGKVLDVQYFTEKLKKFTHLSVKEIENEINERLNVKVIKERDKVMMQAPDELQRIVTFFRWMTKLRDLRKETHCIKMAAMRKLFETIAKKTDLPVDLLENMVYFEGNRLINEKETYVKELHEREKEALFMVLDGEPPVILSGDEATRVRQEIEADVEDTEEIHGTCASKGTARGHVKIINKVEDFGLFEDGDVLVAAMTRPEYMPILKKTAAIVTNDGGITCHAAIVSRELGIPCVIGTLVATKVFKNGDLVEVDADKGMVRRSGGNA